MSAKVIISTSTDTDFYGEKMYNVFLEIGKERYKFDFCGTKEEAETFCETFKKAWQSRKKQ